MTSRTGEPQKCQDDPPLTQLRAPLPAPTCAPAGAGALALRVRHGSTWPTWCNWCGSSTPANAMNSSTSSARRGAPAGCRGWPTDCQRSSQSRRWLNTSCPLLAVQLTASQLIRWLELATISCPMMEPIRRAILRSKRPIARTLPRSSSAGTSSNFRERLAMHSSCTACFSSAGSLRCTCFEGTSRNSFIWSLSTTGRRSGVF
jgi:hypothetical protein